VTREVALLDLVHAVRNLLQDTAVRYGSPGEPHVVSELFLRMQSRFQGYRVSNEYDRREGQVKRLNYPDADGVLAKKPPRIKPDLVVHQVGGQEENLLIVEAKLIANDDYEKDVWKLSGMTDQAGDYRYTTGVHLILDVPRALVAGCDVYIDGALDIEATRWLAARFAEA
jgi:hypothetical protein